MVVKIGGIPIDEVSGGITVLEKTYEAISQPLTVEWAYGSVHMISADLNPLNAPQHIVDGVVVLGHAISNLF